MANSAIGDHMLAGAKTVTSAGTAEALGTETSFYKSIAIRAKAANTGKVYVGGSDVDSSTNGGLGAGDTVILESEHGVKLSDVYIDVGTNGEGVDFWAVS